MNILKHKDFNFLTDARKEAAVRMASLLLFFSATGTLIIDRLSTQVIWDNYNYYLDLNKKLDELELSSLQALINSISNISLDDTSNRTLLISESIVLNYQEIHNSLNQLELKINSVKESNIFDVESSEGVRLEVALYSVLELRMFIEKIDSSKSISEFEVFMFQKIRTEALNNFQIVSNQIFDYIYNSAEIVEKINLVSNLLIDLLQAYFILSIQPIFKVSKDSDSKSEVLYSVSPDVYQENFITTLES